MIVLPFLALIVVVFYLFLQQPPFGSYATGERLKRMQQSPQYKNGRFKNESFTPALKEGVSFFTVLGDFFFKRSKRNIPSHILPSIKTNLHNLPAHTNVLVWFGHSSYFLQVDGKKILVDPVFSGNASPVTFTTKSFKGSDVYTVDDMPAIDYLFISHDHWDHLDYKTVMQLHPKVGKIITGLGVGAHLERWGISTQKILEKDWFDEVVLDDGFKVTTTPARHFSGRGFKRNTSLWLSFVLATPTMKIYLGGDSGYDKHFKYIGDTYGPFDVAILECGQYNEYWKYIHMMPGQVVQACQDLRAQRFIPLHWGKFSLALHAWDEPITRVIAEAERKNVPVMYGLIGEVQDLNGKSSDNRWWQGL